MDYHWILSMDKDAQLTFRPTCAVCHHRRWTDHPLLWVANLTEVLGTDPQSKLDDV